MIQLAVVGVCIRHLQGWHPFLLQETNLISVPYRCDEMAALILGLVWEDAVRC